MDLNEIIKITGGKLLNDYKKICVKGIKFDSRKLSSSDLFIAIKGKFDDGHKYINKKMKCQAIIVSEDISCDIKIPIIKVSSSYEALFLLAQHWRLKYKLPLIAITGSNGKTTLKEMVYNILSTKYKVLKNIGNKNNILGVAETLFNLNKEYDMVVMEMGMNHLGEIEKLSLMCEPECAVITNIGSAHIGLLKSKKNIYKAKMEITKGLNGKLIVNGDDCYLNKNKCFKCGTKCHNDLIAYNIHIYDEYLKFNIYLDKEYEVIFNTPVKQYIPSLLEAIKIGIDYNIDIKEILNCLKNFTMVDRRLKVNNLKTCKLIDDSYNASYESIKCGLEYLKRLNEKKIIILADMLELGKYSKKYHKKLNYLLDKIDNKEILTVGSYTKYIHSRHFNNNEEVIAYLKSIDLTNKYIYIKGSKSMNLDQIAHFLTNTF